MRTILTALCILSLGLAAHAEDLSAAERVCDRVERIVANALAAGDLTEELSSTMSNLNQAFDGLKEEIDTTVRAALAAIPDDIEGLVSGALQTAAEAIESVELTPDTMIHRDGEVIKFSELPPDEQQKIRDSLENAAATIREKMN